MNLKSYCSPAGLKSPSKSGSQGLLSQITSNMFLFLIGIYRTVFTAHFGAGVCRFEPTCSAYANEAFLRLPMKRALILTLKRLYRCRPGSTFGFDPVPSHQHKTTENL